ncbi:hypothetical protein F2P81_004998 [Scophthalmus maximus]|uniref:Uncharacterized protein n=1 Tax=Scophthalmus maximus TaxID=52904 RepID=A0A6A4TLB9_SCOMX|nr:hypothetical protein F2P81_004998 [Scophthalmus maximus]
MARIASTFRNPRASPPWFPACISSSFKLSTSHGIKNLNVNSLPRFLLDNKIQTISTGLPPSSDFRSHRFFTTIFNRPRSSVSASKDSISTQTYLAGTYIQYLMAVGPFTYLFCVL